MPSAIQKIVVKKDIFNDVYVPLYKDRSRFINLVGGAGSGKSVFAAQKLILRLLRERNHRFLLVRKVHRTIRNSQYMLIKDLVNRYGLSSLFAFKDGELSVECPSTNGTIISSGVDNPEKLKSIAGISGTWIEEATELTSHDFIQINLRLRGVLENYKQHLLTYNPISTFHWLNNRFFIKSDPRAKVLRTTYLDNKFIDAEYRKELEALKDEDETLWKIYGLGEWATASGLVYNNWGEVNSMPEDLDDVVYGIDFGFTSPTAVVQVGRKDDVIYIEELIYRSQMSNTELIRELVDLSARGYDIRKSPIYADNEDANRIKELKDAGFYVKAVDKDIVAGLEFCRRQKVLVTSRSTNVLKERMSYKYKQDLRSGLYLETPVKFQDHSLDAIRYALYTHGSKYWKSNKRVFTTSAKAARRRSRGGIADGF